MTGPLGVQQGWGNFTVTERLMPDTNDSGEKCGAAANGGFRIAGPICLLHTGFGVTFVTFFNFFSRGVKQIHGFDPLGGVGGHNGKGFY
jgi:hypothetical protein